MKNSHEIPPVSEEIQCRVDMVLGTRAVTRYLGLSPVDKTGSIAYFEAAKARRAEREEGEIIDDKCKGC